MTPTLRRRRLRRRFVLHHAPLAFLCAVLLGLLYMLVESPAPLERWSIATAFVSMGLLGATLMTGPVRLLRGQKSPVSEDLRRDLGIWSAMVGAVHVVIGIQVHMGTPWLYFFAQRWPDLLPRADLFGVANDTGLAATLVLSLLGALSNDVSLRRLGARRWKRLQRWNYGLVALVAIHGVLYQVIEKRPVPFVLLLGLTLTVVGAAQLAGVYATRRKSLQTDPGRRAGLLP